MQSTSEPEPNSLAMLSARDPEPFAESWNSSPKLKKNPWHHSPCEWVSVRHWGLDIAPSCSSATPGSQSFKDWKSSVQVGDRNTREAKEKAGLLSREYTAHLVGESQGEKG